MLSLYRSIKNKYDVYRGKYCMKKNLYEITKIYCTCKEKFENKCLEDEKYCIIRDHCHYAVKYRGAVHSCA